MRIYVIGMKKVGKPKNLNGEGMSEDKLGYMVIFNVNFYLSLGFHPSYQKMWRGLGHNSSRKLSFHLKPLQDNIKMQEMTKKTGRG